jgi:hypothetical protein
MTDKPEIISRPITPRAPHTVAQGGALSRMAPQGGLVVDNVDAPPTQTQLDMIGETVFYHPTPNDGLIYQRTGQRIAAIITDVHANDRVDLMVLPPRMGPQPRINIDHIGSAFAGDGDPVWEHRSRIAQSKL